MKEAKASAAYRIFLEMAVSLIEDATWRELSAILREIRVNGSGRIISAWAGEGEANFSLYIKGVRNTFTFRMNGHGQPEVVWLQGDLAQDLSLLNTALGVTYESS
jgi:hypothetical protein